MADALTPLNVVKMLKAMEKWWGEGSLTEQLFIPKSKLSEIKAKFPDEMDRKREAVSYWMENDPLASWRRLIRALDRIKEADLADTLRCNIEPLSGLFQIL